MFKKIKNYFYRFIYSLPFGMKAANDEMFTPKASSNSDSFSIVQRLRSDNLAESLIKGEVTQEVEELRYMLYKVYRESGRYKYDGNGNVSKVEFNIDLNNLHLIQENRLFCKNVSESINMDYLFDNNNNDYTLSIIYESFPKYKLEKYCTFFDFRVNNGNGIFKMSFEMIPNKENIASYTFIKELNKISNDVKKDNDFSKLNVVEFVTFKSIGEDDLIRYKLNNLSISSIEFSDDNKSCYLTYNVGKFERIDLIDKFFSESMENKYKNNVKKDTMAYMNYKEEVCHCGECGKEISKYDSNITEATFGIPLCQKCSEKMLNYM